MKLRHLEIFYAVMTNGSLSRAADVLNISQPAASKALKSAEQRVGFTLFQRVRGKLLPTREALVLFEKAQDIYHDLDHLRLLADNLARDPRAKVVLGCLPSLGLSLVPGAITDFYQQNANLVMTLSTDHTEILIKKLTLREIDLALTFQVPEHQDVKVTPIVAAPLVYIDRDYIGGPVNILDIDQERWISPGAASLTNIIDTQRQFATTRLNVQTYYMASEFVKQGVGCSIIDIFSAQHNLTPEMIHPVTPPLTVQLCLLQRSDLSLSPMAQKFALFLIDWLRKRMPSINQKLYPENKNSIVLAD